MRLAGLALILLLGAACAQVDRVSEALAGTVVNRAVHHPGVLRITVDTNGAVRWRGVFEPPDRYDLTAADGTLHMVILGSESWTFARGSSVWRHSTLTVSPLVEPPPAWPSLFVHPALERGPGAEVVVRSSTQTYDAVLFAEGATGAPRHFEFKRKLPAVRQPRGGAVSSGPAPLFGQLGLVLDFAPAPAGTHVTPPPGG